MSHTHALVLTSLLGFLLVANGLFMLVDPAVWYAHVPAVPETGPLNAHFVRDIGCAYAVAGAALIGYAFEERLRAAALAGALFLTLHAWSPLPTRRLVAGTPTTLLSNLPQSLRQQPSHCGWFLLQKNPKQGVPKMFKWLINRQLTAFERH